MPTEADIAKTINVKILGIRSRKFLYKIEKNFLKIPNSEIFFPGTLLKVPLRNSTRFALVESDSFAQVFNQKFEVKSVSGIVEMPLDKYFYDYVCKVAKLYMTDVCELYSSFVDLVKKCSKKQKSKAEKALQVDVVSVDHKFELTEEQKEAFQKIGNTIGAEAFSPSVLYGVTGSGKTEVYKRLILKAFSLGQSSILLFPEIGLCERFFKIFKQLESHGIKVVRYHSALGASENRDVLEALCAGKPLLLMGVHLPTFLPIEKLGLILVDEEHEQGFCKQSAPRIDSKQMAILRAQVYKIPIVLGSATPSISTFYGAKEKFWPVYKLTRKIFQSSKSVEVVSLPDKEKRVDFWITKRLEAELELRLERGEQSIVFINRRGHAFSAQCKACGWVLECKNCSVSMTVHQGRMGAWAVCHYCCARRECPDLCGGCGQEKMLTFKGVGTQKICSVLEKRFPKARIVRVDLDSAKSKKEWPELSKEVVDGKVDILVGTQSIAKGYHFPNVTLVGVIWADLDFNFPSYDAQEAALQRLLQVSGRTGRSEKSGLVVLQAMKSSKILNNLDEANYEQFCKSELSMREMAGFPPVKKFYQVQLRAKNEQKLESDAHSFVRRVLKTAREVGLEGVDMIGPFKPPIHKVSGVQVREIIIKAGSLAKIVKLVQAADLSSIKSSLSFRPLF